MPTSATFDLLSSPPPDARVIGEVHATASAREGALERAIRLVLERGGNALCIDVRIVSGSRLHHLRGRALAV